MSSTPSPGSAEAKSVEGLTLPRADLEMIAGALARYHSTLSGTRILLTGGTGFFGIWLAEALLYLDKTHNLGLSVDLITRSPDAARARMPHIAAAKAVRLVHGDVRNYEGAACKYDYVIHAATESGGEQREHSRLSMVQTIVDGTRNILETAVACGAKGMLYVSSGAVYGRRAPIGRETIDEDYPGGPLLADPDIDHDEGKRMAEALCALYARERGLPVKIARCFAFIGPYLPLDSHFAAGNFLRDALAGKAITVRGDGTPVRTYMYMADLVVWLITILIDSQPGRPYNVGGSEPVSIRELAERVAALDTPAIPVIVLGVTDPVAAVSRIVPSTERAHNELGLAALVDLDDALRRTFAWHRQRAAS